MEQRKFRKWMYILLGLYTLLMLYFLFLGFGRTAIRGIEGFRYNLVPEGIHLYFPFGRNIRQWVFELGNFLLFVPFGMIIPLLVRTRFVSFIFLFIVAITVVEMVQMFTHLGAFDVDDIAVNTLGAAVGYVSQMVIRKHRNEWKGLFRIIFVAIIFSVITIVAAGSIHYYLDHAERKTIGLDKLPSTGEAVTWKKTVWNRTVSHQVIEPKTNLFSFKSNREDALSYRLNAKYTKINGNIAIVNEDTGPFNGIVSIVFIGDGKEVYSLDYQFVDSTVGHATDDFEVSLRGVHELSIQLKGDSIRESIDVLLWDMTLDE